MVRWMRRSDCPEFSSTANGKRVAKAERQMPSMVSESDHGAARLRSRSCALPPSGRSSLGRMVEGHRPVGLGVDELMHEGILEARISSGVPCATMRPSETK